MLARRLTGGLLQRTVDGTKAVLAIGRCRPRGGSVDLVRRMAKHVHIVYVDEHNTSQTCAECGHGLCNTYVSPASLVDLTPLKAATGYKQHASATSAAATKRASPPRGGRRARRGVTTGDRSGRRDGAAAERAKEHAKAVRVEVLTSIAVHGKWAFVTDPLALWGVKLCTNVACPASYVGRDTNAAHNMATIAIKSMDGRSVYPHVRGYTVLRAPPKDGPIKAVRHAAAIEAGTYEVGYEWTRCSPTSWEPWRRPAAVDPSVAVAAATPTTVAVVPPPGRAAVPCVLADGAIDANAASASGDLASSNVNQMTVASPTLAVGDGHSSSSRRVRVIVDCSLEGDGSCGSFALAPCLHTGVTTKK